MTNLNFLAGADWLNPPLRSWTDAEGLHVVTGDRTNFWQETHYGFRRDTGHFLGTHLSGDFTAYLSFWGEYQELYDQAGCMLRIDQDTWIKAGVEYSDGVLNVTTVVTRQGRSDWSVIPVPGLGGDQTIRLTRTG